MDKGRGNTSNVLPLPPNVVQQWQLLQRALAVNKPSPSASQTQQLGPCGGGVSVQVLSSPGAAVSLPRTSVPTTSYTYKVRIINPSKKSDVVSRYLNKHSSRFPSVNAIRLQLIEEFKGQVPDSTSFQVGYFEGSHQAKIWLVTDDDLKRMYEIHNKGGQISLWCEGVSNDGHSNLKRKRDDSGVSKRQEEEDVEDNFKVFQRKHRANKQFTTPMLRLWARTITAGLHDHFDSPPDLPAFSQSQPKKPRKQESLSDALSEAAVSIVHALSGSSSKEKEKEPITPSKTAPAASVGIGVSPGKSVELRMKNFEQLRYLQQFYEDHILDESEYQEQKQNILTALRKL